jgi:uncharacterized membrane protein
MLSLAQIFRLLHIVIAIGALAGLIGRQLTRREAARSTDIRVFQALIQLSGRFESWLVIPGSNLLLISGLVLAWWQGWPLLGFLQGSTVNWLLVSLLLYLAVIPLILFIFLPRGKIFANALEKAVAQGQMTPELHAAFHDPQVRLAHIVEGVLVAAIVYLMVMKPF